MFQPELMKGQRILVTGGGTGLGQAMAERFLQLGADVAICGRRKAVCDATAEAWREKFPKARIDTFGVDIRIAQAVEEMVDSAPLPASSSTAASTSRRPSASAGWPRPRPANGRPGSPTAA